MESPRGVTGGIEVVGVVGAVQEDLAESRAERFGKLGIRQAQLDGGGLPRLQAAARSARAALVPRRSGFTAAALPPTTHSPMPSLTYGVRLGRVHRREALVSFSVKSRSGPPYSQRLP